MNDLSANNVGLQEGITQQALEISEDINSSLRLLGDGNDWNEHVGRVIVILSASRSGSSLIFKALSGASSVVAPAGEHEPWLFLTGNKFPFTESDGLTSVYHKNHLLRLLRNDLLVRQEAVQSEEFFDLLWNRFILRGSLKKQKLFKEVQTVYSGRLLRATDAEAIYKRLEWFALSGVTVSSEKTYWPIENPPYIEQPIARRARLDEFAAKTLLFKSPSDAYRPGFYEKLFPNADITYIHLTRGFAQTVNGLMDGWMSREADFISNPVGLLRELHIEDYSVSPTSRTYWCFDLFPTWQEYIDVSLIEVCAQQWLRAHASIRTNFPASKHLQFESFYTDKDRFLKDITSHTGLQLTGIDWNQNVMSTDKPSQFRWRKRESVFSNLDRWLSKETLEQVIKMQSNLGYSMEESTWH